MNLQQTIDVERKFQCIKARLNPLLDPDFREAMDRVDSIMAEVRHFAVTWMDAAEVERADREKARDLRDEAITRLIQTIRPD